MPPELSEINARLGVIEFSMSRMEDAVTKGMDSISKAMTDMAVVMSKINENHEQHKIIHERIDDNVEKTEKVSDMLLILSTNYANCCGNPKPETPVRTWLKITALGFFCTTYLLLLAIHNKELIGLISR